MGLQLFVRQRAGAGRRRVRAGGFVFARQAGQQVAIRDGVERAISDKMEVDPLAMSTPIQQQIAALEPELPVYNALTMDQILGKSTATQGFAANLVLAFASLSLLLAAVGLYGVLSYLVTQRVSEIGIRVALGAQREQILSLILFDGLRPAFIGLILGLTASTGTTQLIRSMLYGTEPADPSVIGAVILTLLLIALFACIFPAWRASRLDPMQALRTE